MKSTKSLFGRFKGKEGVRLCFEVLKQQRIVQGSSGLAKALCEVLILKQYCPGDVIINQGDGTNDIVFILAGTIIVQRNKREIAERSAGECVGEMAVTDVKQRRCASLVAKEECAVALVSERDFTKVAKRFPELWRCLAIQAMDRLRQRLQGVRPRNDVSRVFIGSSKESLPAAEAVKASLAQVAEPTIWSQGVFGPDKFTLEALEDQAQNVDFAIMVFGPDDVIFSRGKRFDCPRDNVIFELGLFMGALGSKRAFVVSPSGKKLKVPSDLLGRNSVQYSLTPTRSLSETIDVACEDLRKVIQNNGPI
ncbi:MAG: nucleotide-binding protein [Verrucomicrobia bacterium]|nr:nucleotide-binding protein [Verrucomicrobiota bacterium]